jgi:hypothetical protein
LCPLSQEALAISYERVRYLPGGRHDPGCRPPRSRVFERYPSPVARRFLVTGNNIPAIEELT